MNDYCARLHVVKDMNGDLVFSISDVWLIIKFIWLLPAKLTVGFANGLPEVAKFLEINCSTGESWGGGIFSLFVWLLVLGILGALLEGR